MLQYIMNTFNNTKGDEVMANFFKLSKRKGKKPFRNRFKMFLGKQLRNKFDLKSPRNGDEIKKRRHDDL